MASFANVSTPQPKQQTNSTAPKLCKCRIRDTNGEWIEYIPDPRQVIVMGQGYNGTDDSGSAPGLKNFNVAFSYNRQYDSYPENWGSADPDLESNQGKNHATAADDLVLPLIRKLIREGHGPAAVVTGSRGGQVTIVRLWRFWQGVSLVWNGGCHLASKQREHLPRGPVAVLTGGRDFFFKNVDAVKFLHGSFTKWPCNITHYHHDHATHTGETFSLVEEDILNHLIHPIDEEALRKIAHRLWSHDPSNSSEWNWHEATRIYRKKNETRIEQGNEKEQAQKEASSLAVAISKVLHHRGISTRNGDGVHVFTKWNTDTSFTSLKL